MLVWKKYRNPNGVQIVAVVAVSVAFLKDLVRLEIYKLHIGATAIEPFIQI